MGQGADVDIEAAVVPDGLESVEELHTGRPRLVIALEALVGERDELRRDGRPRKVGGEVEHAVGLGHELVQELVLPELGKRALAREQEVDQRPEGVDVGARRHEAVADQLRVDNRGNEGEGSKRKRKR